ncbi:hypothetical protein [Brevibacterium aurantiacum]|uniref:hypothetical protein n=1 Tax=Brevibacterium aurantiacum TaxID=273384 RepID=UPI001055BF40|nr:hypothetical protein [Brevibacterium aurantiacum]
MSPIASILMIAAAVPCVIGAITSRSRLTISASLVMLLAMVNLAYVSLLPPALRSGLLCSSVGQRVAMRLGSKLKAKSTARVMTALPVEVLVSATAARSPVGGPTDSNAESSLERPAEWHKTRPLPRLGRMSAILSAAAYSTMAWQVLNHGAHHAVCSGTDAHAAHQHTGALSTARSSAASSR